MQDKGIIQKLSLKEKVTLSGVAFSPNYFEYAMNAIDDEMAEHPEKNYYDELKTIVFRRLIFEYFLLYCPYYLMIISFILFMSIFLQVVAIITFKKFQWPLTLNKKLMYIVVDREKKTYLKEYEAGFITKEKCQENIERVESQYNNFVQKISY